MANSPTADTNMKPNAAYISKSPDNIFFLLIPTTWRDSIKRTNKSIATLSFIKSAETPDILKPLFEFLNNFFGCSLRGSSVGVEIASGIINFFSCAFLLAVIPSVMARNGYNADNTTAIVAILCGVGNIVSGLVSNLPIIIGPPTPITIYYISASLQAGLSMHQGNLVIFYFGIFFLIMGVVAPIGRFCARIIPDAIAVALTVGVGLISTLSGIALLGIVKQGKYTLLDLGDLDAQSYIGVSAIILTAWAVLIRSKVSNLAGLCWGTFIWWTSQNLWPSVWTSVPTLMVDKITSTDSSSVVILVFELFFLCLLTCFGLCKSLCQLGDLMTKEGMVPNGRFLTITVAIMNILSGVYYGPPIVVIADSGAGIRSGARTGLSSVIAGILFLFAVFFGPLFSAIPPAGYSPVLIMTGILQFKNVQSLDFYSKFAVPAFLTLTLIPFTNSIVAGLGIGITTYLVMSLLTGQFRKDGKIFLNYYFPDYVALEDSSPNSSPTSSNADESENDANDESHNVLMNVSTSKGGDIESKSATTSPVNIELQRVDNPMASKTVTDNATSQLSRRPSISSNDVHPPRARRASVVAIVQGMTSTEIGGDVSSLMLNH